MQDFEVEQSTAIDRIYISWTEQWDVAKYVDHYMQVRSCRANDAARAAIRECIAKYPGRAPFTKVNMDFWLDSNAMKEAG